MIRLPGAGGTRGSPRPRLWPAAPRACHPVGPSGQGDRPMAWDFSTEPEFQEQLEWMRAFVREEIWPLEPVFEELGREGLDRALAPLKEEVKRRRLWATHLP